jgi:hypothetical protein
MSPCLFNTYNTMANHISSTASSILQEWAVLECGASKEEALYLVTLLDTNTLLSLPLPFSTYLPTLIEGKHLRSLFYRQARLRYKWAQFWMFSDKVYAPMKEVYPDKEESTRSKRRREDGTKTISTTEKEASKLCIPTHSLNQS